MKLKKIICKASNLVTDRTDSYHTGMSAVYKKYYCSVGGWTSKYLEVAEIYKQHLAL